MSNTTDDEEEDASIGIQDIKFALEKVFQGCKVTLPPSMGDSYHAELSFYEYEVRVILTGERTANRKMNYRFMQKVVHPGDRKPTKRVILEVDTTEADELLQAIQDTKSHLMGIVYAVTKALKPASMTRLNGIDDLFK